MHTRSQQLDFISTLVGEGRITGQIPQLRIDFGGDEPGGAIDNDLLADELGKLGFICDTPGASRKHGNCGWNICKKHRGHFWWMTPEGFEHFKEDLWVLYSKAIEGPGNRGVDPTKEQWFNEMLTSINKTLR